MGVLVDRFEEHEGDLATLYRGFGMLILYQGPVRAVAIHPSRPLLVTGADDYKIKVWGESMRLPFKPPRLHYSQTFGLKIENAFLLYMDI